MRLIAEFMRDSSQLLKLIIQKMEFYRNNVTDEFRKRDLSGYFL